VLACKKDPSPEVVRSRDEDDSTDVWPYAIGLD